MNRKKKINDLYRGVFKNDKKSCLIDLKPLEEKCKEKRSISREEGCQSRKIYSDYDMETCTKEKELKLELKVAKNLGFGTFFQRRREEIIDIFLAKEDLISLDQMFNQKEVSELFNFKESAAKIPVTQKIQDTNINKKSVPSSSRGVPDDLFKYSFDNIDNYEDNDEVLYEDEEKTIYKRKKLKSYNSKQKIYIPIMNYNPYKNNSNLLYQNVIYNQKEDITHCYRNEFS